MKSDYREIIKYINRVKSQRGDEAEILCGYEAGCLGYSLYHQLTYHCVECVILAPSTMPVTPGKKIRTDRMDARRISKCLAYRTHSAVYVPTTEDDAVKEYIHMQVPPFDTFYYFLKDIIFVLTSWFNCRNTCKFHTIYIF